MIDFVGNDMLVIEKAEGTVRIIKNGVLISNSHSICFAHNKANLKTILNAYNASFSEISKILRKGNLFKSLRNSRIITPIIQVREQLQKEKE